MSKNSFKVRKGLTLSPVDPSEIINPEAGDLIADSTDDNKIKRYDATSADWASVGGSAGIGGNLMPEFEKLTPDLVDVTSAVDTVTFLPIDDNNKSIKATFSGTVGSIQFQAPIDSSLHEIQGTVSVWIRTSVQNLQVSSVQDGVKLSTLPVSATNKWKQYELPVVIGGTEMGFIVESTTGVTGDVYIDQPFVGLTPSSYGFEVAQSEYLGKLYWTGTTGCGWVNTNKSNPTDMPSDADCPTPIVQGRLTIPSTKIPAVVIPAGSPAGTYEIDFRGAFVGSGSLNENRCVWQLSDGVITTPSMQSGRSGGANNQNNYFTGIKGSFTFDTAITSDKTITIRSSAFGDNCAIYADSSNRELVAEVIYYPPKTTIVTQTQEETVETANVFSAKISNTGVVSDENLDWINGNCSISATSQFTCNFNPNIFTVAPNCVVALELNITSASNQRTAMIKSITSTALEYLTQFDTTNLAYATQIICQKQGADYNKSRLIVGQFEQIKSTELCQVEAYGNSGDTITAGTEDIPFATKLKDNCNAWTNAGNTGSDSNDAFTPIRDGAYSITLSVDSTAALHTRFYLYENGVYYKEIAVLTNAGIASIYPMSGTFFLKAGNVYTIRMGQTMTLENALPQENHYINIKELGDVAAIVKNLNDNKNVKCQTKYLSANTSSIGVLPDLTFTNLTIGKSYSVNFKHSISWTATQAANNVNLEYGDGTDIEPSTLGGNHNINNIVQSVGIAIKRLPITQTTLQFNLTTASTSQLLGNGTRFRTYAEVCELPDNYIETDEW